MRTFIRVVNLKRRIRLH